MEETKKISAAEELENQFGKEVDERGKTNAEIVAKAKAKTEAEEEERRVAETQRELLASSYKKQRTLLENRKQRSEANANNVYTKEICDASDKFETGEITVEEKRELEEKAETKRREAYNEASCKFNTELRKLRDANPTGYRCTNDW